VICGAAEFDVLIGINLLPKDGPSGSVAGGDLDADKEGFLRCNTSLIQR